MLSPNLWVPVLVLCAYAPILCWLDLKYRDIQSHMIWIPAIIICGASWCYFFYNGVYGFWTLSLSIIGISIWLAALIPGYIGGADFWYLSLINLFVIFNPITGHLMFLPMIICLVMWTAISVWYIFTNNVKKEMRSGKNMKESITSAIKRGAFVDRGFPMLIPISLALITAVILG